MVAISFPASPSVNDTFTSNGKTWQWNGTFWSLVVSGASVADGSVSTAKIADSAITAAKIADGTVVAAEIASDAITTAKILDANVTAAKIASSAITTDKIAAGAVTAAKLGNDISLTPADGSISAAKIASDAVTTAKILDANVTTAKVAANAITQAKLASNLSAVTVTTTANRDTDIASPFTGQLAILTDTRKIQLYDGTSWVNVSLAPPETPTSLSATALGTTSVSIAFTAGGANGSPITNYKYALSTNGGSTYGSFVAVDPADITTPITISGLTAGTAYYIKLKAVNDMGDSVASAAVSISTLSTPDAPTSLSAGSITATSVDISFTPGSDNGYAISNYQYALSTDSGSTYGSFTALATPDATSPITISGLTVDTAYYVKLKGVNSGGAGTESSAVSFTTLLAIDYLVVAGGGSGTAFYDYHGVGGGGGAGGLRSTVTNSGGPQNTLETALIASLSTNYTVTVGAGGVTSTNFSSNGTNSIFSTVTSLGGGGAGDSKDAPGTGSLSGKAGGSGGGCSGTTTVAQTPGAGTANQGHTGGGNALAAGYGAGGGGGAGAVGGNGTTSNGGAGGSGVAVSITGSSVTYAGGGGGGIYGNGGTGGAAGLGGGAAGSQAAAFAGTANTGGGGGGGGGAGGAGNVGGSGGSGIVILRYPNTRTITLGAGLTGSTVTVSSNKVTTITAGTGNVSWA